MRNLKLFILALALTASACASTGPKPVTVTALITRVVLNEPEEAYLPTTTVLADSFMKLVKVANRHGVVVIITPDLDFRGLLGLYQSRTHRIYLNTFLGTDGRVAVLAHEIGHLLDPEQDRPSPADDIIAQAVSYIVVKRLGVDTMESTLWYYTNYGTPPELQYSLMRHGKLIDTLANQILTEMDQ